ACARLATLEALEADVLSTLGIADHGGRAELATLTAVLLPTEDAFVGLARSSKAEGAIKAFSAQSAWVGGIETPLPIDPTLTQWYYVPNEEGTTLIALGSDRANAWIPPDAPMLAVATRAVIVRRIGHGRPFTGVGVALARGVSGVYESFATKDGKSGDLDPSRCWLRHAAKALRAPK